MENLMRRALERMAASNSWIEDWTALLDVIIMSTDRQLSKARPLAIQRITSKFSAHWQLNEMEKITLGQKYQVKDWLQDGIQQWVTRKTTFSPQDEAKLEPQMLIKLYRIREDCYLEEIRVLRENMNSVSVDWGDSDDPDEQSAPVIRAGIEREFGIMWK